MSAKSAADLERRARTRPAPSPWFWTITWSCMPSPTKRSRAIESLSCASPPASGLRRKNAAEKYSTFPDESSSGRSPLTVSRKRERKRVSSAKKPLVVVAEVAALVADAERRALEDRQRRSLRGAVRVAGFQRRRRARRIGSRAFAERRRPRMVDLERRVRRGRSARRARPRARRRAAWQSAPARTSTCAESAGKPLVTVQTCRSCTSTTPGSATSARPPRRGRCRRARARGRSASTRAGAPTLAADHQRRDGEARDRVEAVPAGEQDERARDAVPAKAARSVATWRYAPRTLRLSRLAPCEHAVATRLTAMPAERDGEHDPAVHVGGRDQPAHRLVDDPDARRGRA